MFDNSIMLTVSNIADSVVENAWRCLQTILVSYAVVHIDTNFITNSTNKMKPAQAIQEMRSFNAVETNLFVLSNKRNNFIRIFFRAIGYVSIDVK